jgi:hypothetical protein
MRRPWPTEGCWAKRKKEGKRKQGVDNILQEYKYWSACTVVKKFSDQKLNKPLEFEYIIPQGTQCVYNVTSLGLRVMFNFSG